MRSNISISFENNKYYSSTQSFVICAIIIESGFWERDDECTIGSKGLAVLDHNVHFLVFGLSLNVGLSLEKYFKYHKQKVRVTSFVQYRVLPNLKKNRYCSTISIFIYVREMLSDFYRESGSAPY